MVFGPIFQSILNEAKDEAERKKRSPYWVGCPACGRQVIKKELIKKGCYVCSWQGTEEELAKTKYVIQRGQASDSRAKVMPGSYRINCPQCGKKAIREEMEKKGCFICGYKPGGCP